MSLTARVLRQAPPGAVAVAILTRNSERYLRRSLDVLARATTPLETWVIDSASEDATATLAGAYGVGLAQVDPACFRHGPARNLCMELTRAEVVVLLVGDAIPLTPDVPEQLARALEQHPAAAGATARQQARPGCDPWTRRDLAAWTPAGAETIEHRLDEPWADLTPQQRLAVARHDHVCAAVRREDWKRQPFAAVGFGEDLLFAKERLLAGRSLLYVPSAVVEHSHWPTPGERLARARQCHALLGRELGLCSIPDLRSLARALAWEAFAPLPCPAGAPPRGGWRAWRLRHQGAELLGQWLGGR